MMRHLAHWGALFSLAALAACAAPAPTVAVDALPTPTSGVAAGGAVDPISTQLGELGYECFNSGSPQVRLARCSSQNPDVEVRVDFQRAGADDAWIDGQLTVSDGQQDELAHLLELVVPHLDPAATEGAVAAARGAPIGVTTVASNWGTINVRVVPGGAGTATLTKAGVARTPIPATPWMSTAAQAEAALVAVGYTCTREVRIVCEGLDDTTVQLETDPTATDAITAVVLSPPDAFRFHTKANQASVHWLPVLAGQDAGHDLVGAIGHYLGDGEPHSVPIQSYRLTIAATAIALRTDSWS